MPVRFGSRAAALFVLTCFVASSPAQIVEQWRDQFGNPAAIGVAHGVALTDDGRAVLTGFNQAGNADVIVRSYAPNGAYQWDITVSGVSNAGHDQGWAVESLGGGNVMVGGYTSSNFFTTNAGGDDIFAMKLNSAGGTVWTRQFGTTSNDNAFTSALDISGNIYLGGRTNGTLGPGSFGNADGFISKLDSAGVVQWSLNYGTTKNDTINGLHVDSTTNIYTAGFDETVAGPLDRDAVIQKLDSAGAVVWQKTLSSPQWDFAHSVVTDSSGNVYASGFTFGSLDGNPTDPEGDLFVVKYDSGGTLQWLKQYQWDLGDNDSDLALLADGHLVVTTGGDSDTAHSTLTDVVVAILSDINGAVLHSADFGGFGSDLGQAMATLPNGRVVVVGQTNGTFDGPVVGSTDGIILSVTVPEPSFALIVGVMLMIPRRKTRR